MSFKNNMARMISLSVVWGSLLVTHLRRRRQDESTQHTTLELESQPSDSEVSALSEGSTVFRDFEVWPQDPALTIHDQSVMVPSLIPDIGISLLRRILSSVGSFVSPSPAEEQAVVSSVDRSFNESMNIIKSIASCHNLPTHLPESFYDRLPFRRSSSNNRLKALMEELELLTFYSKSSRFLNAVAPTFTPTLVQHTVGKLENMAIYLLATYFPMDELESNADSDLKILLFLDVPAARNLTPFPSLQPKDHFIRFGYCQFQFASFLANLSLLPEAVATLSLSCLKPWLELWSASRDIRLQLLSAKIQHNVFAHKYLSTNHNNTMRDDEDGKKCRGDLPERKKPRFYLPLSEALCDDSTSSRGKTQLNPPVIYGPDVFKLDERADGPESSPPEVDIIFINGMLGSVFHTWRQRDSCDEGSEEGVLENGDDLNLSSYCPDQVNCWPRTWLSEDFPKARILGINANLKPFIWNPICPAEKTKRRIDQRARDILQQLLMAGVGRRPIVWVAHSAGGVLTKEVLRLSATWIPESHATVESNPGLYDVSASQPLLGGTVRSGLSGAQNFNSDLSVTALIDADASDEMSVWTIATKSLVDMESPTAVAQQTRGIIFLSVPHRGNQSMMFLYYFPMVFTLTPEAKQLRLNNASIISLHNWFLEWTSKRPLQVLNMIEDRQTVVNRWYSVHLVQPEPQDDEFSEVVPVDTDHTDICKPKDRQDEVYVRIAGFIHRLMESI